MRTNCIAFVVLAWLRRRRVLQRKHPELYRVVTIFGWHWVIRRSHWGPFPHFLYGRMHRSGMLELVSYKPIEPKKRRFPPLLFEGRVQRGDKKDEGHL
jgi:hypothetical protein